MFGDPAHVRNYMGGIITLRCGFGSRSLRFGKALHLLAKRAAAGRFIPFRLYCLYKNPISSESGSCLDAEQPLWVQLQGHATLSVEAV